MDQDHKTKTNISKNIMKDKRTTNKEITLRTIQKMLKSQRTKLN